MDGMAESGRMTLTPDPGMLKVTSLRPRPEAALAFRMAWRNEPGPLSATLVTTSSSTALPATLTEPLPSVPVTTSVPELTVVPPL